MQVVREVSTLDATTITLASTPLPENIFVIFSPRMFTNSRVPLQPSVVDTKSISPSAWTSNETAFYGLLQSGVRGSALGHLWPGTYVWGSRPSFSPSVSLHLFIQHGKLLSRWTPKIRSSKGRLPRILSNFSTTDDHNLYLPRPKLSL